MDARQYPVYGLYAARVSPAGKVLDTDGGKALDAEDPAKIAKAKPPGEQWLGDRNYWWQGLASRFQPSVASDGTTCLVTYLRDVHSNDTTAWALRVSGADLGIATPPVKLSGSPKDRVAVCRTGDGWAVAMDHWVSGWSPTPRLAVIPLSAAAAPQRAIPGSPDAPRRKPDLPPAALLDLQKALAGGEREAGEYQQGKGHFTFWQSATAWDGRQVVVASDYGWRTKFRTGIPTDLVYAVVAARMSADGARFIDDPPLVLATGKSSDDTCPRRPALAAGPAGEVLAVYEWDAGVDKLTLQARLLRP